MRGSKSIKIFFLNTEQGRAGSIAGVTYSVEHHDEKKALVNLILKKNTGYR